MKFGFFSSIGFSYLNHLSTASGINESDSAIRMTDRRQVPDTALKQTLHVDVGRILGHLGQRRLHTFLRPAAARHQTGGRRGCVGGPGGHFAAAAGVRRLEQHVDIGAAETERVDASEAAFPRRAITHNLPQSTHCTDGWTAYYELIDLLGFNANFSTNWLYRAFDKYVAV